MKLLTTMAGAALIVTCSFPLTQAGAMPFSIDRLEPAGDSLLHQVRGKRHAFGHRVHRNRGLHRGWRIGRHNPHRG